MGRGYQHSVTEKLLSEINKTHTNWKSSLLKQNSKEEKEMLIAFRDTISALGALGVYYKRKSWILIQNQPLICKFFKNHLPLPTRKENHGKELPPRADVSLLHGF